MKNKEQNFDQIYVKKLRRLRVSHFISQKDIAAKLKVSQPAYAKIENGKTKLTRAKIDKVCKILKISVQDFLTIKDDTTRKNKRLADSQTIEALKDYYERLILIKDIRIDDLEIENIKLKAVVKTQKSKMKFL